MQNILVADDEKEIVRLLRIYLEEEGYRVFAAYDGEQALEILKQEEIHLALVDIMMPGKDGYQVIKQARMGKYLPILVISAKTSLGDRILGLELGADDYITKPFEPLEVVARVRAQLRKNETQTVMQSESLTAGDVTLNLHTCMVEKAGGSPMELTKAEFNVLKLLMSQVGRVFTKDQIYGQGWSEDDAVDDNTIRVIISRLRTKVGAEHIKTIRGLGYRYEK